MGVEKQRLFEEKGVCVSDHMNGLQYTSTKSDSFVVDMERFSHIIEKDINANSRITLQRNLSRKGSFRSGEKKTNSNAVNEKDTNFTANSPRASSLVGGGVTPEKPMALTTSSDQHTPQTHNHQITIVAGHGAASATESKIGGRRFSFRRSTNWTIDPRRILLFFATLSSMGTMLLIYFTLSIAKLNGEDIADLNG
uniref:Putative ovule protein n=1 Tax=Solanum chacoense TaxID=4108 RepID=A0A0V0HKM9_SOLCH